MESAKGGKAHELISAKLELPDIEDAVPTGSPVRFRPIAETDMMMSLSMNPNPFEVTPCSLTSPLLRGV